MLVLCGFLGEYLFILARKMWFGCCVPTKLRFYLTMCDEIWCDEFWIMNTGFVDNKVWRSFCCNSKASI